MDIRTYIQGQMVSARSLVQDALQGITDEQFNWPPPGTINPISAILLHLVAAEDVFVQTVIQGKLPCWLVQEWGQKIGVQAPPAQGRSWAEFRTVTCAVAPVLAYDAAVRLATDAYLAELTAEELDRRVLFDGSERAVADMLMLLVVHSAGHAGEIAAVKGMQGLQGLPY